MCPIQLHNLVRLLFSALDELISKQAHAVILAAYSSRALSSQFTPAPAPAPAPPSHGQLRCQAPTPPWQAPPCHKGASQSQSGEQPSVQLGGCQSDRTGGRSRWTPDLA